MQREGRAGGGGAHGAAARRRRAHAARAHAAAPTRCAAAPGPPRRPHLAGIALRRPGLGGPGVLLLLVGVLVLLVVVGDAVGQELLLLLLALLRHAALQDAPTSPRGASGGSRQGCCSGAGGRAGPDQPRGGRVQGGGAVRLAVVCEPDTGVKALPRRRQGKGARRAVGGGAARMACAARSTPQPTVQRTALVRQSRARGTAVLGARRAAAVPGGLHGHFRGWRCKKRRRQQQAPNQQHYVGGRSPPVPQRPRRRRAGAAGARRPMGPRRGQPGGAAACGARAAAGGQRHSTAL